LVPTVDRKVVVDEPILFLSDAEVVKVGLPVFALVGLAEILSVLGRLNGEEDTARSVVLEESLVAAGCFGEAVDETATSDWVNIVVPVDFVVGVLLVVVFVAVGTDVLVVILIEESDAGADTRNVALHVLGGRGAPAVRKVGNGESAGNHACGESETSVHFKLV
jgi:hypothetical protein